VWGNSLVLLRTPVLVPHINGIGDLVISSTSLPKKDTSGSDFGLNLLF
jgi:hypothetical protein